MKNKKKYNPAIYQDNEYIHRRQNELHNMIVDLLMVLEEEENISECGKKRLNDLRKR